MYALEVIKSLNTSRASRAAAAEDEFSRHCSYTQSKAGVVLHSAKFRSTLFLSRKHADTFLREARGCDASALDDLIEDYFLADFRSED